MDRCVWALVWPLVDSTSNIPDVVMKNNNNNNLKIPSGGKKKKKKDTFPPPWINSYAYTQHTLLCIIMLHWTKATRKLALMESLK